MKFILDKDKLEIEDKDSLNSGSIRYYEIEVETDETWNDLNIEAVLLQENADRGIGTAVINNKVYIDRNFSGKYLIGFKGYTVQYALTEDVAINTSKTYYTRSGQEGSYVYTKVDTPDVSAISTYYEATKDYQVSTKLIKVTFKKGAGEVELENEDEIPSISEWEVYVAQLQDFITDASQIVDAADNLNLEISKVSTTATVTLTKKDGTEESVEIHDGAKGDKGDKGDTYTITSADYNAIAAIVKGQITIPTKLSDLTNDTGFITDVVNTLTNYYLKTDTYTKTEVNNLIGQISTISIVKVNTLPAQGQSNIIYLVPNNSGESQDIFDEYLWIDNAFEKIGNTKIDLTGYATETWVTSQISNFLTSSEITTLVNTALANYYTKTQVDTLLSNKADNTTLLDYMQKSEAKLEHNKIINQIPTGTTNTNPVTINDSADLPLQNFSIYGVSGQNIQGTIITKKCNQNILDYTLLNNSISDGLTTELIDNGILINNTRGYAISTLNNIIKLKPNTKYTISCKTTWNITKPIAFGWKIRDITTDEWINNQESRNDTFLFTTTNNTNFRIVYYIGFPNTSEGTVEMTDIMLVEGEYTAQTIPDYIVHAEKTYNFTLLEGQVLTENDYIDKNGIHTSELIPFTPEQQSVIDEIINDGTYKEVTHYEATANINPDMEVTYYKELDKTFLTLETLPVYNGGVS